MKKPKLKTKRLGDIEYTESSGNVFADLGVDNPEEALAIPKSHGFCIDECALKFDV